MRAEPLRVRDRDAGPTDRTLERAGEVAVGSEPQRSPLGVMDPDPLDDGRLVLVRLWLPTDN
jgi:hypothetical protein